MTLAFVGLIVLLFVVGTLLSRGGKREREGLAREHVCALCGAVRPRSAMRNERYLPTDRPFYICRNHDLTEAA